MLTFCQLHIHPEYNTNLNTTSLNPASHHEAVLSQLPFGQLGQGLFIPQTTIEGGTMP